MQIYKEMGKKLKMITRFCLWDTILYAVKSKKGLKRSKNVGKVLMWNCLRMYKKYKGVPMG